jgi:regulator of cell morphogenesis and NO signaling
VSSITESWDVAPLDVLVDHIVNHYHRALEKDLPRLEALLDELTRAGRDPDGDGLGALQAVYLDLKAEIEDHMMKEEQVLFPMIRRGQGSFAEGPIAVMRHEHDDVEHALERIRSLTNDYTLPDEASATRRALWEGLSALGTSLHAHIHLENDILFPRALAV